ncbi:MarR family winged helix-turn-helix transcriptional regulator [Pseudonocardia xishanensis]|uniref:MarR family transcriptional regulator n=1 Tax=Pseudonocardia xishanensis TaxID=630995 RepID=A0ABP8S2J3_9PSEU
MTEDPRPPLLDSTQLALFERILAVGKLVERASDRMLRAAEELPFLQYHLLIRLRNLGGEARMSELAKYLVSTPSGVTYLLARLERRGLAERVPAPGVERGVLARITPAGRALLRALSRRQNDLIVQSVVEPLRPDELNELHRLLGILQDKLRREPVTEGLLPDQVPEEP